MPNENIFETEGKIKTFSDKQKLKELISIGQALLLK
jgi:hypothetical protein